jgi:lysozyme
MAKQKKKTNSSAWLIVVLIVAALVSYIAIMYEHQMEEKRKAAFALYPAYGINIPTGYPIHGIDVSAYQNIIDWQLVRLMNVNNVRVSFAFMKATEGISSTDKQFANNWQMSKQAAIPRGAYHYFIATKNGALQAQNFINTVKLEPGDLPPVVDIEQLYGASPDSMRINLRDYLQMIEAAYHVRPVIYSYADFYDQYLGKSFDDYPLWVAHYNVENAQADKDKKVSSRDWTFWQHNQEAHVDGIVPKVDFDVFGGDSTAFAALRIK